MAAAAVSEVYLAGPLLQQVSKHFFEFRRLKVFHFHFSSFQSLLFTLTRCSWITVTSCLLSFDLFSSLRWLPWIFASSAAGFCQQLRYHESFKPFTNVTYQPPGATDFYSPAKSAWLEPRLTYGMHSVRHAKLGLKYLPCMR